jgi:hypothetical protein
MGIGKYASVDCDDGSDVGKATKLVSGADAVVLVVGLTSEGQKPSDEVRVAVVWRWRQKLLPIAIVRFL